MIYSLLVLNMVPMFCSLVVGRHNTMEQEAGSEAGSEAGAVVGSEAESETGVHPEREGVVGLIYSR